MLRVLIPLSLLLVVSCAHNEQPTVGTKKAAPGEAPRPFRPGENKGEWEDPRYRELKREWQSRSTKS